MTPDIPTEGDPTDHIAVDVNGNPIAVRIDDDGQAIDSYFEGMSSSGIPRDYLGTGDVAALPRTSRLLSRTVTIGLNNGVVAEPLMLFPPDVNRLRVVVDIAPAALAALASKAMRSIAVTTPAAGAQWSYTVPAGEVVSLAAIRATLTTDATVANRVPGIEIVNAAGTVVYSQTTAITVPASTTRTLVFAPTAESSAPANGVALTTIPDDFILNAGWIVRSTLTAGAAGDAYTAITLLASAVADATAEGVCRLASDKSDCYGAAEFRSKWENDAHTGAVWVYAPNATGPVVLNAWTVTV